MRSNGLFRGWWLAALCAVFLTACKVVPPGYEDPSPKRRHGVVAIQRSDPGVVREQWETIGYATGSNDSAMAWLLLRADIHPEEVEFPTDKVVHLWQMQPDNISPQQLCQDFTDYLQDVGGPPPKLWSTFAQISEEATLCSELPPE